MSTQANIRTSGFIIAQAPNLANEVHQLRDEIRQLRGKLNLLLDKWEYEDEYSQVMEASCDHHDEGPF